MPGKPESSGDSFLSRDAVGSVITQLGVFGLGIAKDVWRTYGLLYDTITHWWELDKKGSITARRQIVSQVLFTGVEALWLVTMIALVCGITIVLQAATTMPRFGVSSYFGDLLVVALVRELGPFLTSLVVIGRSGSALATYIASMKVNKEVAALRVMGIDPVHFIVIPALVGMVISTVSLSVYFDILGVFGGLSVAALSADMPFGIFVQKILQSLTIADVLVSIGKSALFGVIIAMVSCYQGMKAENPRQVPRAARTAVIGSMVTAMLFNIFFTVLMYGRTIAG